MAISGADAVRRYPSLSGLVTIRRAGWRFLPVVMEDGWPDELDAVKVWPQGWRDGIRVRSESDALGIRVRLNSPPEIVWERGGTLVEVVGGLLCLPAPGHRLAPRLAVGSAPAGALWTP